MNKRIILALSISMLLSSLGTSIANVALPSLTTAFDASFSQVQWVVTIYLLATTILMVIVGRVSDMISRRTILLVGLILYTGAALLCGIAPTLPILIFARALQGIGAAILMVTTVAFVGGTFAGGTAANGKLGSAMGLMGTMSAVGTAGGPSLGGFLIAEFGWRAIFLAVVPLGLFNFYLSYRALPHSPKTAEAATVKTKTPLIPVDLLRSPVLTSNFFMNSLVSMVMMSTLVVGPFYLSQHLSMSMVGAVMSVGPVTSSLTGAPSGRAVDRFGAKRILILGLLIMITGITGLWLLPQIVGVSGYIASTMLLSLGYQLFQAANGTLIMTNTAPSLRGSASGLLSLSRNVGLMLSAALHTTFGAAVVLSVSALMIALAGVRRFKLVNIS